MGLYFYIGILLWCVPLQAQTRLDKYINEAAVEHGVSERTLRAIAYVESRYGIYTNLRYNKNKTLDVGAFQINSVHWTTTCRQYNVMTLRGNTYCAALILSTHKRHRYTDTQWECRYHSSTPVHKARYCAQLQKYKNLNLAQKE